MKYQLAHCQNPSQGARDTSAAFGEDEVDRFFEECLHEGDDDGNQAPTNQVSFKDLEAFIEEIKERFNCVPKTEKSNHTTRSRKIVVRFILTNIKRNRT